MVDNDDEKHVQVNGTWSREKSGSFGPSRFINHSSDTSTAFVQFNPKFSKNGKYTVYTYYTKTANTAPETKFLIYDGNRLIKTTIVKDAIVISGQTAGSWTFLGSYEFKKDQHPFVKIMNSGVQGLVNADAVLFVPVK